MKIITKLVEFPFEQEFAVIDVESDTAVKNYRGRGVTRNIVGKVLSKGPSWDSYIQAWMSFNKRTDTEEFMHCNCMMLETDMYSSAEMKIIGDVLYIKVIDRFFEGESIDEYYQVVKSRNERCKENILKWELGKVSRNELREALRLDPVPVPAMDDEILDFDPKTMPLKLSAMWKMEKCINYV
jgi:hypothetical protein